MDMSTMYLVWSPYPGINTFNAVITPTASSIPLTPFIATPLPYFTFSPQGEPKEAKQQSETPHPSFFAQAPILQPVPGSKERPTPRKRRAANRHEDESPSVKKMRAETTSDTAPNTFNDFAYGGVQVKADPHAVYNAFQPIIYGVSAPSPAQNIQESVEVKVEPRQSTQQEPRQQPENIQVKIEEEDDDEPYDDNENESDYVVEKKRRRPRTRKHLKLNSTGNQLDQALVAGGLKSPILRDCVYVCLECSKSYRLRKHCRRHMITHMKAMPFSCDKCDNQFSRQDSLQRHAKRCKGR